MWRQTFSLLTFLSLTGVLVVALKLIDWLPAYFQPGAAQRYASVAEAQSVLGIPKIYVPAYFPKTLEWPPSRVVAQSKPFVAVILEFRRVDSRKVALVVTQTSSRRLRQRPRLHLMDGLQTSIVPLKGRKSVVERGFCDDGEPCSKVTFAEGDLWISIEMRSSAEELLVLAGSMLSGPTQ